MIFLKEMEKHMNRVDWSMVAIFSIFVFFLIYIFVIYNNKGDINTYHDKDNSVTCYYNSNSIFCLKD